MSDDSISVKVILDPSSAIAGSEDFSEEIKKMSSEVQTALSSITLASRDIGKNLQSGLSGVSSQLSSLNTGLNSFAAGATKASRAMNGVAHSGTGVRRELLVMGHEIVTERWTRLAGSFIVLGERMDILSKFSGVAGLSMGAMAATTALVVYEMAKGADQAADLTRALTLTGNAAGLTQDKFNQMAADIAAGNAKITQSSAKEGILAAAKTGAFDPSDIQEAGALTAQIANLTGETAEKVAGELAKMREGVAKWAEANELAYGNISPKQLEHIQKLEEEGDKAGAAKAALDALSGAIKSNADELGYVPGLWDKIGQAIDGVIQKMREFGAAASPEQIAQKYRDVAKSHREHAGTFGAKLFGQSADDLKAADYFDQAAASYDKVAASAKKLAAIQAANTAHNKQTSDDFKDWTERTKNLDSADAIQKKVNDDTAEYNRLKAAGIKVNKDDLDALLAKDRHERKGGAKGPSPAQRMAPEIAEDKGDLSLLKDKLGYERKLMEDEHKAGSLSTENYYAKLKQNTKDGMDAEIAVAGDMVKKRQKVMGQSVNLKQRYSSDTQLQQSLNQLALLRQQEDEQLKLLDIEKRRSLQAEALKDAQSAAKQANTAEATRIQSAQAAGQQAVAMGQSTNERLIQLEEQLAAQRFLIAQEGDNAVLAAAQASGQGIDAAQEQALKTQETYTQEMTKLQNQMALETTKNSREAMTSFTNDLQQLTDSLIEKPRQWKSAFEQFFLSINQQLTKQASGALIGKLLGPGTGAGGFMRSIFGKLFGEPGNSPQDIALTANTTSLNALTAAITQLTAMQGASAGLSGFSSLGNVGGLFQSGLQGMGFLSQLGGGLSGSLSGASSGMLGDLTNGGTTSGMSSLMGMLGGADMPAYATGTPYVPTTGLAMIHQGEAIIPAAQNSPYAGGGIGSVTNNFNLPGGTDLRTQQQMASMAGGAIQRAMQRS